MKTYYNEIDAYAAQWLRNLIAAGLIPAGDVDTRSIVDVRADDLVEYRQCHFFAGIGGWALAARIAGWPDDRELWTGSCPCQPFSVAGKGAGAADARHLWPDLLRLTAARRPAVLMGEQVAAAVGKDWLDGVQLDLAGIDYACGRAVIPACAVNAPHRRDRLWFVAGDGLVGHCIGEGLEGFAGHGDDTPGWPQPDRSIAEAGCGGNVAHADGFTCRQGDSLERGRNQGSDAQSRPGLGGSHWRDSDWITGHDGKARRVKPGVRLLAHGVPARVGKLRAYGNAIVPALAAEIIGAYMDISA